MINIFFNLYPAVKSWRTIRSNTPCTPYPTDNTLGCHSNSPPGKPEPSTNRCPTQGSTPEDASPRAVTNQGYIQLPSQVSRTLEQCGVPTSTKKLRFRTQPSRGWRSRKMCSLCLLILFVRFTFKISICCYSIINSSAKL